MRGSARLVIASAASLSGRPPRRSSLRRMAYWWLAATSTVTGRRSCARLHSACTVYWVLPSETSATTRRPGQAMAAPSATGRP